MSDDPNKDFITNGERLVRSIIKQESEFFSNVEVLTNAAGDLDTQIIEALEGLGLFIIVDIKRGPLPGVDDTKPWDIWITAAENPIMNRGKGKNATGKTCRMAIEELARLIDEKLGIAEANVEPVPADGKEIMRITGKILLTIKGTEQGEE